MESIEMDTKWIDQYNIEAEKYDMFYEEPIRNINVYLVYVNKEKEISEIKQSTLYLNNLNVIEKEDLVKILSERDKKFKLTSMFTYNIDLNTDNVKDFFFNTEKYDFVKNHTQINDIQLQSSISFFQELNGLYLLCNEITKDEKKRNTKRVMMSFAKPKTRKNRK